MEDDGIMVKVYDNLQDEIKGKNNVINQMEGKLKSAQFEIDVRFAELIWTWSWRLLGNDSKAGASYQLQQQILNKI